MVYFSKKIIGAFYFMIFLTECSYYFACKSSDLNFFLQNNPVFFLF
jgi:hypothetical protein